MSPPNTQRVAIGAVVLATASFVWLLLHKPKAQAKTEGAGRTALLTTAVSASVASSKPKQQTQREAATQVATSSASDNSTATTARSTRRDDTLSNLGDVIRSCNWVRRERPAGPGVAIACECPILGSVKLRASGAGRSNALVVQGTSRVSTGENTDDGHRGGNAVHVWSGHKPNERDGGGNGGVRGADGSTNDSRESRESRDDDGDHSDDVTEGRQHAGHVDSAVGGTDEHTNENGDANEGDGGVRIGFDERDNSHSTSTGGQEDESDHHDDSDSSNTLGSSFYSSSSWTELNSSNDSLTPLTPQNQQYTNFQGEVPQQIPDMSAEAAKLKALVERIVQKRLPLAKMKARQHRGLPAKYLLKQFFASFKEYREQQQRLNHAQLDSLVQALNASQTPSERVEAMLQLVLYHTSKEKYNAALEQVQQAQQFLRDNFADDEASVDRVLLAQLQDAVATYLHLNNDLAAAGEFYQCALKSLRKAHAAAARRSARRRIKYLRAFVNVKYGALLVDAEKPKDAQRYFDRAVKLDPKNMDVYVHRSQLWRSLKKPEKSQQDLETAVAIDSTVASTYVRLAVSCLDTNREKAVMYLQRAKELAPNDANVASAEIEIISAHGNVQEAMELADRAASLDRENPLPLVSKVAIVMQAMRQSDDQIPNDINELLDTCSQILRVDRENYIAFSCRASTEMRMAWSWESAQRIIETFEECCARCRDTRRLKEYLESREYLKLRAIERFPNRRWS